MEEKVEKGMSAILGAIGGIAIEWEAILSSAINAAIAGFVGALFGLFAKWVWNQFKNNRGSE